MELKYGKSDFERQHLALYGLMCIYGQPIKDHPPITFAEWSYQGKGKLQRRDFRFDVLTGSSKYSGEGSLFADLGKHDIFTPIKT